MNENQQTHSTHPILVAGIGSPHGDDQLGWTVAREVATVLGEAVVVRIIQAPIELIDWLDDCQQLIVCDACHSGCETGTLHRWDWPADALRVRGHIGSHSLSLPFVLTLAKKLGKLPDRVTIWGIELREASTCAPIGTDIQLVIPRIVRTIADEITRHLLITKSCNYA